MKSKNLTKSLVTASATVAGAMSSRVLAENVPLKNTKIKHAVLSIVGIAGAALLDRKDTVSAFTQDLAIGFAATQTASLIKDLLGEKANDGVLKTALGSPVELNNSSFLASYNNYDFIPAPASIDYEEQPIRMAEFR